jgi:NTP pyrophosphatase (non-canonical NTP hydrolase)
MQFADYQTAANKTDQIVRDPSDLRSMMIPLLGLAGESGSLLTEYKKYLRDGDGYKIFNERITEELGDILWYLSTIATKAGLDLDEVARRNLDKIADRWHEQESPLFGPKLFDDRLAESEQLPRHFEIEVCATGTVNGKPQVQLYYNGKEFGDPLTDNAYEDDGYRLHDVFHLAFVAVLGWSPVLRGKPFFNCKRKSSEETDEVQDGGRAAVIDEAIAALIFIEAKKNSFFEGIESVEYQLLRTIKDLTSHLEVGRCSGKEWETAILQAFQVWRALKEHLKTHSKGKIIGDLNIRKLMFVA